MFERLISHGAELARRAARRRREALAEAAREEAPVDVEVSEEEEAVVLTGPGLERRFALEPALRRLFAGSGR